MDKELTRYFINKELNGQYGLAELPFSFQSFLKKRVVSLFQIERAVEERVWKDMAWVKERHFYEYEFETDRSVGERMINI